MADATTWIAAVGPIAGYVGGLVTEVNPGQPDGKDAQAERDAIRQAELQDRRNAFEQETLAALTEAVSDYIRWLGATREALKSTYTETGRWGRDELPEHLTGEAYAVRHRS